MAPPAIEGWLLKPGSMISLNWKPRFFKVDFSGETPSLCFSGTTDGKTPKGILKLEVTARRRRRRARARGGLGTSRSPLCSSEEAVVAWSRLTRHLGQALECSSLPI
jgi:hypothetical protein